MFGKDDYGVVTILFLLAGAALSVCLLVVGIPRLVITGGIKFGPGGILIGGAAFPFPWYLLVPTIVIVAGTIISVFKTTVKENTDKIKIALGVISATLLASISYFVYMADYWYTTPISGYGLPTGNGTYAIGFTTPYTAYPPPAGYSQYLYYTITAAFLIVTVILLLRAALKPSG